MDLTLDLVREYQGIKYKVVQILESDMMLVVPLEDFLNNRFPMAALVIPYIK